MADKFINGVGVAAIRDWADNKFAKDSDIPTKLSELTNDGDGTAGSAYATEEYVGQNGGKIDSISVNNTAQTIDANKNVNITVPTTVAELSDAANYAQTTDIPTNVSDLTNDSGYQTASDVDTAIDEAIGGITEIDYQVVNELPQTGENGVIYLVPKSGGSGQNVKDEYIWVNNAFEAIGTTEINLSDYWAKADLVAMTVAEINAILEPSS